MVLKHHTTAIHIEGAFPGALPLYDKNTRRNKMSDEKKIVECNITSSPSMFDLPKVMVKLEGSDIFEELFDYYPDEISFTEDEFIGRTADEARNLKFKKDKAYLQS